MQQNAPTESSCGGCEGRDKWGDALSLKITSRDRRIIGAGVVQ